MISSTVLAIPGIDRLCMAPVGLHYERPSPQCSTVVPTVAKAAKVKLPPALPDRHLFRGYSMIDPDSNELLQRNIA